MSETTNSTEPEKPPNPPILNAPSVVVWMFGLLVVSFILAVLAPRPVLDAADRYLVLEPIRAVAGIKRNGGLMPLVLPFIGHMFVHANLGHIVVNSLSFLAFGGPVARRLAGEGMTGFAATPFSTSSSGSPLPPVLFVMFFLMCGAAGGLAFVLLHMNEATALVGASGGVSGLLGGLVRFAFRRPAVFSKTLPDIAPLTDRMVVIWTLVTVVLNIVVGVFGIGVGDGAAIAWEAHLGGYFFGLLTFPIFDRIAANARRA